MSPDNFVTYLPDRSVGGTVRRDQVKFEVPMTTAIPMLAFDSQRTFPDAWGSRV
jgi:hypothetical protein